jgi:serine/threonine-protein kinase
MTLESGTKLGRYEIRSQIGAGGMGEVYLAQDTKLDRKVALKILPADLAANEDRMRRFVQEAKAAAALNHPNIATIYEIGESDNVNFIAMEFIDGVTLREKIHQERTELRKLLRFLQHAAEGLAKAHAAGIVHRDLKPDNIMITRDGHAKILDFGLAKLVETSEPGPGQGEGGEAPTAVMQQHSVPGMIMGTVGYMSPEQAQARPVDQRSDIFSFGCILYEAATGRKPFAGDSVVDTLHKIIHAPAPAITDFYPSAPPELQRVIRKCLAKEPEKRYQTIRDTANDLEEFLEEMKGTSDIERSVAPSSSATTNSAIRSTADDVRSAESTGSVSQQPASSAEYVVTGIKQHKLLAAVALLVLVGGAVALSLYLRARNTEVAIKSIAVMPFVNESGNPDLEYLSDGMTETLISSLSQLPNLNVKGRSSVFRYKGKDLNTKTLGKELGVQAVLYGRVIQRGDQLTLSLELLDAVTENVIWSGKYDRKQGDLVSLQKEIAADVSNKLKSRLTGADEQRVAKTYTSNTDAYQLYLKGRFFWNQRNAASLKKAAEYFQQAIDKDPTYALAYSGLADSYALLPNYSGGRPEEYFPKAKAAALEAVQLDDNLAEGHTSLGNILIGFEWNIADSTREFKRAIELNPNYATAHHWYSDGPLLSARKFDESIVEMKRAQEIDPLSLIINAELGTNYTYAGQYEAAIDQLRKTIQMDDSFYLAHWNLGLAYRMKGQYSQAIAEYQTAMRLAHDPQVLSMIGEAQAASGDRAAALKTLADLKDQAKKEYVASFAMAQLYGALGDKDEAFRQLEEAYRTHAIELQLIKVNPMLNSLQGDRRLDELTKRVFKE